MLRRLAKLWIIGLAALVIIGVFVIPYRQGVQVHVLGTEGVPASSGSSTFASIFAEWAMPIGFGILVLISLWMIIAAFKNRERSATTVHYKTDVSLDELDSSRGVETLMSCMRNDVFGREQIVAQAIDEFKNEGAKGSDELAVLISDLLDSRSRDIVWALSASKGVEPTKDLVNIVEAVSNAPTLRSGGKGRFIPEIAGDGQVGWADATAKRIMEIAGESLVALTRKIEPAEIKKLQHELDCSRCGAPAVKKFGFTQELVCLDCFNKDGVCSSCGKQFGSDAELIVISAGKNCRDCDAKQDELLTKSFKTTTRFVP